MQYFLFLFFSSFYIFFVSNTIFGGDSGDLVSAIITKGFAHPPGYPLYTFIGTIFTHLPFDLSIAGKVTVLSSLATAGSLCIVYLVLKEITKDSFDKKSALLAVLIGSVNYLIWLYADVPEVFPLNTLIVSLIVLFSIRFYKSEKSFYFYGLTVLAALGIAHHHTFILVMPAVFILLRHKLGNIFSNPKKIIISALFFVLGISPFLYFYFSNRFSEVRWGDVNTAIGFFALLARQGYGTFVAGPFISNFGPERFVQLVNIFYFCVSDFTFVGFVLIFAGLILMSRKPYLDSHLRTFFYILLFITGPFFYFYANFPLRSRFEFATVERFYLQFYALLLVPLYFGFRGFFDGFKWVLKKKLKTKIPFPVLTYAVFIIFLIIPVGLFIKNRKPMLAIRNNLLAEQLGKEIISNTSKKSIFILSLDTILFDTQYVYFSNKASYTDHILIHASKITFDYYQKALSHNYPKLNLKKSKNTLTVPNFIANNLKNFDVYSNDRYPLPGLPNYKWVPQGILFKLVPLNKEFSPDLITNMDLFWKKSMNTQYLNQVKPNDPLWKHNFLDEIKNVYAIAHQNSAFFYLQRKLPDKALPHIKEAKYLNTNDKDSEFLLAKYYEEKSNCSEAEKTVRSLLKTVYDDVYVSELLTIGNACYGDESNKTRIANDIKNLQRSQSPSLKSF